jgi:hypothetical protein
VLKKLEGPNVGAGSPWPLAAQKKKEKGQKNLI